MAPTASSKSRDHAPAAPVAPPRKGRGAGAPPAVSPSPLTRHASLRLPRKSPLSSLTSPSSPAEGQAEVLDDKPDHHQSLSTVAEQEVEEEREQEEADLQAANAGKKTNSLLKKIGIGGKSKANTSPSKTAVTNKK